MNRCGKSLPSTSDSHGLTPIAHVHIIAAPVLSEVLMFGDEK